jgi:hypothetical protein
VASEQSSPPRRSFLQTLQHDIIAARASANEDPWEQKLRKLKGKIGHDGIERISTCDAFDELEVPMRRRPSETVKLTRFRGHRNICVQGVHDGEDETTLQS